VRRRIEARYAGPPNMGHGGYVAGMLVDHLGGAAGRPVEVTLRRPVPLDTDLELTFPGDGRDDGGVELRNSDEMIAEAKPASDGSVITSLDVPPPPTLDAAASAEAGSPSLYDNGRGVHPTCFGCGNCRTDDEGLQVYAGPLVVDGRAQVAGRWRPGSAERTSDGWLLAALDCPGAFAFIAEGTRAGLLGRIAFQRLVGDDVTIDPGADHVVTGWQIGVDGRKMFAGTALFDAGGRLLAAAKATWFGFPAG
jgi:hypothetical protein